MDRILHARRDAQAGPLLKIATTSPFDRQAAIESWKRLLLTGALAGAGARSAIGLVNLLRRNLQQDRRATPEEEVRVPLPAALRGKQASDGAPKAPVRKVEPVGDPWNYPAHWVMGPLALGGGAVAAYNLVDWLVNRARKSQLQADTEAARQAFLKAIAGQHDDDGSKTASDNVSPVVVTLDGLFDLYQKKANYLSELVNKMKGAYALYALASGLLTGTLAYGAARRQNRERILEEAERRLADVRRYESPPRLTLDVPRDDKEQQP